MTEQELKQKYGKIYRIDLTDDGDKYTAYFRRPDFDTLSAFAKLANTDSVKAAKILVTNLFIGGDEIVKDDAILIMNAGAQLAQVVNLSSVPELKKI